MNQWTYTVELKQSAQKEIEALPTMRDRQRVLIKIRQPAVEPRPSDCVDLASREAYRIRQGRYRIIYTIADTLLLVEVMKVGHRGIAYRT